MKIQNIEIVQEIMEWVNKGPNHSPNDVQTSIFVGKLIPYLEELEQRIEKIEIHLSNNPSQHGKEM